MANFRVEMLVVCLILAVVAGTAAAQSSTTTCLIQTADGKLFYFPDKTYMTTCNGENFFYWNPCSAQVNCSIIPGAAVCLYNQDQTYYGIGAYKGRTYSAATPSGFSVTHPAGPIPGQNYYSTVAFTCNSNESLLLPSCPSMPYRFTFNSPCACSNPPAYCRSTQPTASPTPFPKPTITPGACSIDTPDGLVDLTPLTRRNGSDWTVAVDENNLYLLNICGQLTFSDRLCPHGSGMCFVYHHTVYNTGVYSFGPAQMHLQYSTLDNSVYQLFTSDNSSSYCLPASKTPYSAVVVFQCDQTAGVGTPALLKQSDCIVEITWRTSYACPDSLSSSFNQAELLFQYVEAVPSPTTTTSVHSSSQMTALLIFAVAVLLIIAVQFVNRMSSVVVTEKK